MADSIGSLSVKLTASTGDLDRNLKAGAKLVDDFSRKVTVTSSGTLNPAKTLAADVRQADKAIRETTRSAGAMQRSMSAAGTLAAKGSLAVQTFGISLAAFAGLKAAGGIADTVADAVASSVRMASNFEQVRLAFEVMLGSAGAADKMLARVRDFAASSPLTFTEAAGGAKQLIAYGIAADQAVPTLRMLSDVSLGNKEVLGRMVYAYGQVSAATRLYGTELRQFSETGIPIVEELGKTLGVPTEQVRKLVEEGKVGFPDLVKTFKRLTEDGGKFAGMTERYGQTFAGQVERLTDSVEVLKREFGQALIEELGLKEATQDLGRFADRVKGWVGEMRPAIRFVGDLGKGVAQLGYELGRAAAIYGRVHLESIAAAVPELRGLPEKLHQVFKEVQDFRLDPRKVVDVSLMLTRGTFAALDAVWDFVQDIGAGVNEHLIQPFLDAAKAVKEVALEIKAVIEKVDRLRNMPPPVTVRDPAKVLNDPNYFALTPEQAAARHRAALPPLPDGRRKYTSAELVEAYTRPDPSPADFHDRRFGQFALAGGASWIDPWDVGRVRDGKEVSVRERIAQVSKSAAERWGEVEGNMRRLGDQMYEAQERERQETARRRAADLAAGVYPAGSALVGGAFDAAGKAARDAAAELNRVKLPEGSAGVGAGMDAGYRLPDAAEVGSQQAAAFAAMAFAGQGSETAEGIMRSIERNTAREADQTEAFQRTLADILARLDAPQFRIGGR